MIGITLAAIVLGFLAFFIALSVLRRLLKFAFFLAIIFLLIFLATGKSINQDFALLQEKLRHEPTLVLLEKEGAYTAGFTEGKDIYLLSDAELAVLSGKGTSYEMAIVISTAFFKNESYVVNNKPVNGAQLSDYYTYGIPIESITFEDFYEIDINNSERRNMKSGTFAYVYEEYIRPSQNPLVFFRAYQDGEIIVEPETPFFSFAKLMPLAWIEEKLNKLKDAAREEIRNNGIL